MPPSKCRCRARRPGSCSPWPLTLHPEGEAIWITQVDNLARSVGRIGRARIRLDEAREALLGQLDIASQRQLQAVGEPQLPGMTRAEHDALQPAADGCQQLRKARIAQRHFRLAARWPEEHRQLG